MALNDVFLQFTPELVEAVDDAAAHACMSRAAFIESVLWRAKAVRDAAERLNIEKQARRGRGRPRKDE